MDPVKGLCDTRMCRGESESDRGPANFKVGEVLRRNGYDDSRESYGRVGTCGLYENPIDIVTAHFGNARKNSERQKKRSDARLVIAISGSYRFLHDHPSLAGCTGLSLVGGIVPCGRRPGRAKRAMRKRGERFKMLNDLVDFMSNRPVDSLP
jgi:hypothetical protein